MVTSQGQVILLLVVLVAGFIIGAALAWWLASRGNTTPADQEQDMLKELRKRYTEKLSLWQDRSSGQLAVRSGDVLITSVRQLTEAQKRSMNGLLKDWAGWMGFLGSQTGTSPAARVTEVAGPSVAQSPETGPAFTNANLEESVEGKAGSKVVLETPKSIVDQINEILQDKLKTHPALVKGIRLSEDSREGVVVWVGLEHYNGVDAVTDPEVKEVLREAVLEWERRTQPGN
jgi:hypothetical protein